MPLGKWNDETLNLVAVQMCSLGEAYSDTHQTPKMEFCAKVVNNGFQS